ncbi:MAG: hypothetical protein FJW23_17575 [Acidimicrobiia bacterium]|nr:hypothetical protein [Acidimicrobiia bacterium]
MIRVLATVDTFARQQKRRWVAELRRGVKLTRRAIEHGVAGVSRQVAKAWVPRRRRLDRAWALRMPKLLRPFKIAGERLRNLPLIVRNLSRKALLYVWGLRRPFLHWRSRRRRMQEKWTAIRFEARIEQEIERLADTGGPLVVGPWLSEVGYETLYWVPFVRWFQSAYRIKADRLLVLSRGGAAAWYADITPHQLEVFDFVAPETFAAFNASRSEGPGGTIKQLEPSAFEADLVARAQAEWGVRGARVLHPSLMYRLFQQFWAGNRSLEFLDEHTTYARIAPPPDAAAPLPALPADYVAVKFYSAQSLQDTPETRRVLRELLAGLAERHPVVMLDTGLALDDHGDYAFAPEGRIVSARAWMTPRNNLAVQTRLIAGARAFVGTCGSVAWLAPMLGTDTTAVMTDVRFLNVHLHAARRVYRVLDAGRFTPFDLGALSSLGLGLSGIGPAETGPHRA